MVCILFYIFTLVSELENDFSMKENPAVSVFYTSIKVYFFGKKKKKKGDLGNCFHKHLAHSKIEFLIFIMCGRPITGKKSNQKI